ncbi:MAG: RluA family pseudouridine synthase [Burkholderiales bacterium]|nr:RluA family pseudouridine synthase [Burkholderiales bacterium]
MFLNPNLKTWGGETVVITPILSEEDKAYTPENIALDIVYQDEHIIVINKPAGLTVHPGNGNWSGTLLNSLLFHYPELKYIPRAGIVHRLDKDTSGLMVVARTLLAQTKLVQDLQLRRISRIYRAIVEGHSHKEGIVKANIGRDPNNRIKMAVLTIGGKEAITHFKVLKYFEKFSYIECKLETGRTHQIRVHMKSINHPIIGDPLYGQKKVNYTPNIVDAIESLNRQALHAIKLSFNHPATTELMQFKIPLAYDIKYLLQQLMLEANNTLEEPDDEDNNGNPEVFYVNE